jgi:hypothetical protein
MIFLDFEASAAIGGYAIEVGFCMVDANREKRAMAKLIRHDEWLDEFQRWDSQAAQVHNIDRTSLLKYGEAPAAVMRWLNSELAGMVAIADSRMDTVWLRELAAVAGIPPAFGVVDDLAVAFVGPEIAFMADAFEVERVCPKVHRADRDAEHLATWYLMSILHGASVHRLYLAGDGSYERRQLA